MIYQGDIEGVLKENNITEYMILNNELAIIYVDDNFNEDILNNISEIAWWNESMPLSSLINITNNFENGESVIVAAGKSFIENNPYIRLNGENIIVAIIDSGIDYLHPDFIDYDGKSRIISIWDQENDEFSPPEGFIFGSEFTNEDINRAIEENNSTLSVDNIGTGTLAAGIVGGNGRLNFQYRGVVRQCDLVVVKLREYEGTYKEGKINYTTTDFLAAIKYVTDIAQREQKPIIINLTIGSMANSTSNTNIFEVFNILSLTGVIVVTGAGNEGNTDTHYYGQFTNEDEVNDIIIQIGEQENIDIVLNATGPDKINATLISPSGEVSYTMKYSPEDFTYEGVFNLEKTFYSMRYIYPWIASGTEQLEIKLRDVKPGIWTLRLTPEYIVNGEYDVYLPNKNLISEDTRFIDPDSEATITMYGAASNVITVGAYNDKTNSMWIGSSKGPIRGGGIKPDIVAPGVEIISTYIGSTYNTGTGSGVSSSIVSGVLAMLIEYVLIQSDIPKPFIYTEVLKTYLMLGATKKIIYTYPNTSQGYGILNLQNTIEEISRNL